MSPKSMARALVLAGIGVVILAAGILSFAALRDLGRSAGWSPMLSALFPISIDVYALISTVSWLVLAEGEDDRRRSGINAFAAVAMSVLGNAVEHLAAFQVLSVGWPVVVVVSAIPPLAMALSVHLAVRFLAEDSVVPEASVTVPKLAEDVPADSEQASGAVRNGWAGLPELVKLDRARAAVRDLAAEGFPVTGAAVAARLGTTDRTGRTYLRKLRAAASA